MGENMKMKNKTIAILLAVTVSVLVVGSALAGSSRDLGRLKNIPLVGTINYYAWINKHLTTSGVPIEIMTEDSYNSSQGFNMGYYSTSSEGPRWRIIVENFQPTGFDGDQVNMVFGGIGDNSHRYWYYNFNYVRDTESTTDHGTVGADEYGPRCPVRYPSTRSTDGLTQYVKFSAEPFKTYQIYLSQNSSGADPDNGGSNGRFLWIGQTTTDANGYGVFGDTSFDPTAPGWWYEIIWFDAATGKHGCHSEPVSPTSTDVVGFTADYDSDEGAVKFGWETYNESNISGFNVYRSDTIEGPRVKINDTLIPVANPGSTSGSVYDTGEGAMELWDRGVVMGRTYYYWLEAIYSSGPPTTLRAQLVITGLFKIFAPVFGR